MSLKVKDRCKPIEPPLAPGTYMGVCVGVVDIGEQYSELFKKYDPKIMFIFDIPSETKEEDGKQVPKQISKSYTFSWGSRSALRKALSDWNSRTYEDNENPDLREQLGTSCLLTVALNETKEYSNITGITALPKGLPEPKSSSPQILWDMDAWDDAAFSQLPQFIQDRIKKSTQYQKDHAPQTTVEVKEPAAQECPI